MNAQTVVRNNPLRAGWWVAVIAMSSGLGGGVVFPILPMLGVQLGLSVVVVGLILAINRITRIFCNPLTGSLVDRFGARWPVSAGLFLAAVAVLAFSVALHSHSPGLWFLGGRIVWGVGSSLIVVGSMAAVMVISEPSNRTRLLLPGAAACAVGFAWLALAQQTWGMALALAVIGLGSGALTIPLLALLSDTVTPQTQGRVMGIYQVYSDIGGSIGPILGLQLGAFVGYRPIFIGIACAMVLMVLPLYHLARHEHAVPQRNGSV